MTMSNYTDELNCHYCGGKLTPQEIDYIQHGTSVRCQHCGTLLTRDQFQSPTTYLVESPSRPIPTPHPYQPRRKRGSGALIFFIGLIVLSLGLYSWVIYIPIFSEVYYGEIFGIIVLVKGLSDLRNQTNNPSAFWIIIAGLFLWIMAWLSWIIYIPILSDGFIGEFGGLGLMIFGCLKSQ